MNKKTKDILRKGIYAIIFIAMLSAFIYLGNKYAGNSEIKVMTIKDYYKDIAKENFEVISDINGVISSVERHFFDFNKGVKYFCTSATDIRRTVDDTLCRACEKNSQIFKAIFVCTGVINSVCINANSFFYFSGHTVFVI